MFFFGFRSIFIVTQMHGLGRSRRVRWVLLAAFIDGTLAVYAWRCWDKLNEIVRIPIIDYVSVFLLAGILWLVMWVARRLRPQPASGTAPLAARD
jgi:hypothetical protein